MNLKCLTAFVAIKYVVIACLVSISIIGAANKNISGRVDIEPVAVIDTELNNDDAEVVEITEETIKSLEIVGTSKIASGSTTNVTNETFETEEIDAIVEVEEKVIEYINCDVPENNTMKTYMSYKAITSKNSRQYKLQESLAYTDDNGLRMVGDRYCVALGSYYTTTIGQWVDIELENGEVIKGILADCKADKHTDSTNRIHPDGSVVEFVVDTKTLNKLAKKMGDISYINNWKSKVVNIKVYDKVEEF